MNVVVPALARALLLTILAPIAWAGPGHDHGAGGHDHGEEAPAPGGTANPRFAVQSELFEAVGVLQGGELAVYVDRYADNAPVLGATVEIESGEFKATGTPRETDGSYVFAGASFATPGRYPIVLTVTAGDDLDLLAGNLDVPDTAAAHHGWFEELAGTAKYVLAAIALAVIVFVAMRVIRRRRHASVAGV